MTKYKISMLATMCASIFMLSGCFSDKIEDRCTFTETKYQGIPLKIATCPFDQTSASMTDIDVPATYLNCRDAAQQTCNEIRKQANKFLNNKEISVSSIPNCIEDTKDKVFYTTYNVGSKKFLAEVLYDQYGQSCGVSLDAYFGDEKVAQEAIQYMLNNKINNK